MDTTIRLGHQLSEYTYMNIYVGSVSYFSNLFLSSERVLVACAIKTVVGW